MGAMPRLGVIIVTHQSERHIAPLWRSLAATIDRERTSICVFDNASTDQTVEILNRENAVLNLPLQLVRSETNLGFCRANNEAFDVLQAGAPPDVIVLLNPDVTVQKGWWQPLVETLAIPGVGAAVPLLLLPDGTINSRGNALHFLGLGYVQGLGEEVSVANFDASFFSGSGAAVALGAEALAAINRLLGTRRIFWDELFIYAEDSDLGWRLRLAGFEPRLCAASRVTHDYHFPISQAMATETRLFWIERNRYLLMIANFKLATLFLLLPWIVASEFALACGVWRLHPRRVYLWRAIWKEIRSTEFWPRRRRLQAGRRRGDREILRAMTGSIRHGAQKSGSLSRLLDDGLRCSHRLLCLIVWW